MVLVLGLLLALTAACSLRTPPEGSPGPGPSPTAVGSTPVATGREAVETLAATTTVRPQPTNQAAPLPPTTPGPTPSQNPAGPTPTDWEYPTPGPGVGTPFSHPQPFIIHHVQPGEGLAQLAQRFQTTEEVLDAVNGRQPAQPLLAGELLVVPAGLNAPGALPVFMVLYLRQSRSLAAVAREYATSEEALRRYNALGAGAHLPVGRWLIVPVAGD